MRTVNENHLASFFKLHFAAAPPGTFIYICALGPKGSGKRGLKRVWRFVPVTEPGRAARVCLELSSRGYDVYFGVQPRLSATGGGGSGNVAGVVTIPVDNDIADRACFDSNCDGKDRAEQTKGCRGCHYQDGRPKLRSREEAHERYLSLALAGLPVSAIVRSGGGLHGYFYLKEMLSIEAAALGAPTYSDVATLVGHSLSGDSISDLTRILRPPGTYNRKPNREPTLVEWEISRPGIRYGSLADVFTLVPAALHVVAGSQPIAGSRLIPLPFEVPERIRRAVEVAGWRFKVKRQGGTDKVVAVVIYELCPQCVRDPRVRNRATRGTAHVSPSGFLRCKRRGCEASKDGGIPYDAWVSQFAPNALWSYSSSPTTESEPEDRCSLSESQRRLHDLIERAVKFAEVKRGNIALVSATPGIGKTRAVLERFVREGHGSLLASSHRNLDEREHEAKLLGLSSRRRHHGILSRRESDDMRACVFQKELKPWAERGYSIRNTVCASCSHRTNYRDTAMQCPAYKGVDGRGIVLAVHAHAPVLAEQDALKSPVIFDECPSLVETTRISAGELGALIKEVTVADLAEANLFVEWCAPRAFFALTVRRAMRRLARDVKAADERYPRRLSGVELRRRLADAARECTLGNQKLLLDEAKLSLEKLDEIARQMALAHADRPTPPPPLARDMRGGDMPLIHFEIGLALMALDREGREGVGGGARETACICANRREAWVEWRRSPLDRWKDSEGSPISMVILDATAPILIDAIRAALPRREARLFRLDIEEDENVTRVFASTSSLTRRALLACSEPEENATR